PAAERAQRDDRRRDLQPVAPTVVEVVDADTRPRHRRALAQPAPWQGGGRTIARARGCGDDARVDVTVWIGERAALGLYAARARIPRALALVPGRGSVGRGDPRMRAGVRPDLPAGVGEPPKLAPRHRREL